MGTRRDIEDVYPLTPMQQGMLFHSLLAPHSGVYFLHLAFTVREPLDAAAFQEAWRSLVARHAVLRTSFLWEGLERPIQVVHARAALPFTTDDWSGLGPANVRARLDAFMADDRRRGFVLSEAPLSRLALIRTAPDAFRFVASWHHLVVDGWSLARLFAELLAAYAALKDGNAPRLEPVPPYRDYVAWLGRQDAKASERFWRDALAGFVVPTPLGIEPPRPGADQGHAEHEMVLPASLASTLRAVAQAHRLTVNTIVQGAWAMLLSRRAGRDDVLFGATIAGRPAELPGVERMIGLFLNTLPVRVRVDAAAPLVEWLATLQARNNELRQHEHSSLALVQGWSAAPRGAPLFHSLLVFENVPVDASVLAGGPLAVSDVAVSAPTNYPLTVYVRLSPAFSIALSYDRQACDPSGVAQVATELRTLLERVAAAPTASVGQLRTLPEALRSDRTVDIRPAGPDEPPPVDAARRESTAAREPRVAVASGESPSGSALGGAGLRRIPRDGPLPLSSAQQRLWFLDRVAPGTAPRIGAARHVRGPLDVAVLRRALDALVRRHESLRTRFGERDGTPYAEVVEPEPARLELIDLSGEPAEARLAEARRRMSERLEAPLQLGGEHFAARVIRVAPDEHVVVLVLHHAIADARSSDVSFDDLFRLYDGFATGREPELAPLVLQHADYAAWEREAMSSAHMGEHLAYWKEELAGAPTVLELPADRPRPPAQSFRGRAVRGDLDGTVVEGLRRVARQHGASLYATLLAAWQVLLHRYSGQDDVLVGSPVSSRADPALEAVVGCFVNDVVLRGRFAGNPTFAEVLARTQHTVTGALEHCAVPFEVLVDSLGRERSASHPPVFQVRFALHPLPRPSRAAGLTIEPLLDLPDRGASYFDLTLEVAELPEGLAATYEYGTDLFDPGTIERMHGQFHRLLREIAADPARRIQELPLLGAEDERLLLGSWTDTELAHDRSRCVHDLLEATARRTPDALAAVAGGVTLTYRALDERANRLAHLLARRGAAPGSLVAVCVDRSCDMPVALAAVLKAGAAYVPLDPTHPAERLRYTLEDAGVACAITLRRFAPLLEHSRAPLLVLDEADAELAAQPATSTRVAVTPQDRAYVIYTSGSTGRPKGVEVEHRNVVAFLAAMRRTPGFDATDVMLAVTTLSFDIAGLELWLPLSTGGRVVVASRADVGDGARLAALLEEHGATVMQATPSTWRLMLDARWSGSRTLKVLCGGEPLPHDLAANLVDRVGELWNMYGPTETTIWSTVDRVANAGGPITIGRPIHNTRVYVLERSGHPAPIGVIGELCIAGEGVARGYHDRPELTAEKFVTLELPGGRRERVYRTGDVARFRSDGRIDFLGRRDHQVKVRGHRIELGEIESVLAAHRAVRQAVVVTREASRGDVRLVAFVVCQPGEDLTVSEVRQHLRKQLPDYMIPSVVVTLDAIPLTPNGKVDRAALPDPFASAPGTRPARLPPAPGPERQLADVWQELLRVDSVSADDNFFELGGHSLLTLRVTAEMERRHGWRLDPRALFFQTLRQVAAAAAAQGGGAAGRDT